MDLLETRELSYFVAVAEELHFGRAAARLGVTQPPLSRAIKQLERRIGTDLFHRTSRQVTLTPAGQTLLHEARLVLQNVTAAVHRARRAGQPQARLTLAMKPGGDAGLLPAILDAYRAQPHAVPVDVVFSIGERADLVRSGVADAALLHRPNNDLSGLATEDLAVERQIVILPQDHRLATAPSVCLRDLAGEPRPRWPGAVDNGATGPEVTDVGQLMQLIAMRQVIAVVPTSAAGHLRHDLVGVPVTDAPRTTLVLAWPEHSRSADLAQFVYAAATAAIAGPKAAPSR